MHFQPAALPPTEYNRMPKAGEQVYCFLPENSSSSSSLGLLSDSAAAPHVTIAGRRQPPHFIICLAVSSADGVNTAYSQSSAVRFANLYVLKKMSVSFDIV